MPPESETGTLPGGSVPVGAGELGAAAGSGTRGPVEAHAEVALLMLEAGQPAGLAQLELEHQRVLAFVTFARSYGDPDLAPDAVAGRGGASAAPSAERGRGGKGHGGGTQRLMSGAATRS